jgi:hypothetical protein
VLAPDTGPVPAWSAQLLARGGGQAVPEYGTPEWAALDDGDPVKVAATVAAAEAWRAYTHPAAVADRLRLELDAARHQAAVEAEAAAEAAFQAVASQVRARAGRPTLAELAEERGDHVGLRRAWQQADRLDVVFAHHLRAAPTPERTPVGAVSTPRGRAARARRLATAV